MATGDVPTGPITHSARDKLMALVRQLFEERNRGPINMRQKLEQTDRDIYRTTFKDAKNTQANNRNKAGLYGADQLQDPVVPVTGPQVEAAHGYMVDLFLTSYPIFPVVSNPQLMGIAQQIETIMGNTAQEFNWVSEFSMVFKDGLKHNLMAMEVEWEKRTTWAVKSKVDPKKPETLSQGTPVEVIFEGNKCKRVDLYNLIADFRVPPHEVHSRGDYVGYVERITRNELEMKFRTLSSKLTMNYNEAMNSKRLGNAGIYDYYVPTVNDDPLVDISSGRAGQDFDWYQYLGLDTQRGIEYSGTYDLLTLYIRIIPREFGIFKDVQDVPQKTPVIYKLLVVNGCVPIYLERKTNGHNFLPIVIGQMKIDGNGCQTKSFSDDSVPYQRMATSLYASAMESQRRKVYDRMLYNPTLVDKEAIERVSAVARIPVKPAAYTRSLAEVAMPLPYRDEGIPQILGMVNNVLEMSDVSSGQNRIQRGQFQKGNKSVREFETVMNNSDSRPRTMAVIMESAFFGPIKWIIKMNMLQYQQPTDLYHAPSETTVQIEPKDLRAQAWQFQIADGVLPVDKLVNPEMFNLALNLAGANPAMAAEWDLIGMLVYQMKIGGAKWVDFFKRNQQQQQQFLTNQANINGPRVQPSASAAGTGANGGAGTIGNG